MAEKQIIYAAVNTNEMDKRVVVCKDKEEFPVVVTLQDNIFLETAKKLVLAELKQGYVCQCSLGVSHLLQGQRSIRSNRGEKANSPR